MMKRELRRLRVYCPRNLPVYIVESNSRVRLCIEDIIARRAPLRKIFGNAQWSSSMFPYADPEATMERETVESSLVKSSRPHPETLPGAKSDRAMSGETRN